MSRLFASIFLAALVSGCELLYNADSIPRPPGDGTSAADAGPDAGSPTDDAGMGCGDAEVAITSFTLSSTGAVDHGAMVILNWETCGVGDAGCELREAIADGGSPKATAVAANGDHSSIIDAATDFILTCTAPDSSKATATLHQDVNPVVIEVCPLYTSTVLTGVDDVIHFNARVTGAVNSEVDFYADYGTISRVGAGTGSADYAPPTNGEPLATVTVRSRAVPSVEVRAQVRIYTRFDATPPLIGKVKYLGMLPKPAPIYVTALNGQGATTSVPANADVSGAGGPYKLQDLRLGPGVQPAEVIITNLLDPTKPSRDDVVLGTGGSAVFKASVSAPTSPEVSWSIDEQGLGATLTTSTPGQTLFTAPSSTSNPPLAKPTVFHLRATSKAVPNRSDVRAILVLPTGLPSSIETLSFGAPSRPMKPGETLTLTVSPKNRVGTTLTWTILERPGPTTGNLAGIIGDPASISYAAPLTNGGDFHVVVTDADSGGAITASGVVTISVWDPPAVDLFAFADLLGTGSYVPAIDPAVKLTAPFTPRAVNTADLVLQPPAAPSSAPAPSPCVAYGTDGGGVVLWGESAQATGYDVYVSATSNFNATTRVLSNVPPSMRNLAFVDKLAGGTGLTDGSQYYVQVVATNARGDSTGNPVCSFKAGQRPSDGTATPATFTVGGAAGLGGATGSGTLYVFLAAKRPGQSMPSNLLVQRIPNPASDQPFSITGVPAGDYEVGAFFDVGSDGVVTVDPTTLPADGPPPVVGIIGNTTLAAKVMLPVAPLTAVALSGHRSIPGGDSYAVDLKIQPGLRVPLQATLVGTLAGGTFQAQPPSDLRGPDGDPAGGAIFRMSVPATIQSGSPVSTTYLVNAQGPDGRMCTMPVTPSAWVTSMPRLTDPPDGATVGSLTPTFQWYASSLPASGMRQNLSVRGPSGEVWAISLGATASSKVICPITLDRATPYEWEVSFVDSDGNASSAVAHFVTP